MKNKFKKQMFVHAKSESDIGTGANTGSSQRSFIEPATSFTNGRFNFRIPPDAPVFQPTAEEFLDPLDYIAKIKPIAEKTGICKIKPPAEWQPPFAVDVDHFKFTPRIQKLNELDANTRVKLYFLDRLATYWNCTGTQIRIPAINEKTVDMYSLYKIVELEGGFEIVNSEKKWPSVAARMGYDNEKVIGSQLKHHYKRLLLPYEKFEKKMGHCDVKAGPSCAVTADFPKEESPSTPLTTTVKERSKSSLAVDNEMKRRTRSNADDDDTEILFSETFKNPIIQDKNKELQKLTFYGPGPKILAALKGGKVQKEKTVSTTPSSSSANSPCIICGSKGSDECLLLCEGCDDSYHTFCLMPVIDCVPKGEWRCPKCIAAAVNKPNDSFGFEQAEREYTLQQFGEMADQFKSNYFNMPVHLVPTQTVEHEYWRILSSMDSSVTVEYGADLHSMDHGSGFPTQSSLKESGADIDYYKSYVDSNWNLNNIPVLEGSVLGYINADISGMKIPWMYVGMCFSTFCWHNEDHWSYSINYLHWGEPKTWYGVPGFKAEDFERVMQETTPDLFRNQPDLLHQLVTILNPNILMDKGVPVYHIDQAAGEFVLTFPRAYHAGFNHGYNFAEAVNFAPVDWIPLGRQCIDHYSTLHRYCVFSHDELICKMAALPNNLNSKLAEAAYEDMIKMLDCENRMRKLLLGWGVINAEREAFELLADDERQCWDCNTTCFLSAVTCKCSAKKVACLRHFKNMCSCPALDHTLKYRYTLDELPVMLNKLKEKVESISIWAAKVQDALDITTPRVVTLTGLKELLNEAREKRFPDDPSLNLLSKAIKACQDALAVDFRNILSQKQTLTKKVTVTEIKCYYDELKRIPCVLPQEHIVKHFLDFLTNFKKKVTDTVADEKATIVDLEALKDHGNFPNVHIPEIGILNEHLNSMRWLDQYRVTRKEIRQYTLNDIEKLIKSAKSIIGNLNESFPNFEEIKSIIDSLTELKNQATEWEETCNKYLKLTNTDPKKPFYSELEDFLKKADKIESTVLLPSKQKIIKTLKDAGQKKAEICKIISRETSVSEQYIESVIQTAQNGTIRFEEISTLENQLKEINAWKDNLKSIFLKDGTALTLFDVLCPVKDIYSPQYRTADNAIRNLVSTSNLEDEKLLETIYSHLKTTEKREFQLLLSRRIRNMRKRMSNNIIANKCSICNSDFMPKNTKGCVLCKCLFHLKCSKMSVDDDNLSLCSFCQRGKRPSIGKASDEIKVLENLKIRTIEGVILQRLINRAKEWNSYANAIMQDDKIKRVLNKVEHPEEFYIFDENDSDIHSYVRGLSVLELAFIRGSLIELYIPTTRTIWKMLKNSKYDSSSIFKGSSKNDDSFDNDEVMDRFKPECYDDESKEKLTAKLVLESIIFKNELEKSVLIKGASAGRQKQTIPSIRDEVDLLSDDDESGGDKIIEERIGKTSGSKRKRPSGRPRKQITESSNNINNDEDEEIEFEDEEDGMEGGVCDMEDCLRPDGDHVDWVQCDYCKCWLHMVCVGVTKKQVELQNEFICDLCVKAAPNIFPLSSNQRSHFLSNFDKNKDLVYCSLDL